MFLIFCSSVMKDGDLFICLLMVYDHTRINSASDRSLAWDIMEYG